MRSASWAADSGCTGSQSSARGGARFDCNFAQIAISFCPVSSLGAASTAAGVFDADARLRVLASPTLRQALELVATSEISSGDLAAACGWTRPATSQHLRALRQANLVDVRVLGNRRLYRARARGPGPAP